MIRTFTQNDLVEYIYQEKNDSSTEVVIENSEQLNSLNNEFSSMKQLLSQLELKPPERAIDAILAHAKQQKQSS